MSVVKGARGIDKDGENVADRYADLLVQILDLDDEDLKALQQAIEQEIEDRGI